MSAAQLPPTRHALSINVKDSYLPDTPRPAPPKSPRTPSPSSPSRTPKPASPALEKPDRPPEPPKQDTDTQEDDKQKTDEIIDMETFQQIIDLDEDDNREFSTGMVDAYFKQATETFKDMDTALSDKDLKKLSSLGHFLKGSSAALGVTKVKDSCEKIQHYGQCRDEELDKDLTEKEALDKIESLLVEVKEDYAAAERWLKEWREGTEP